MAAQTWTSLQNSLVAMLSQAPSPYTQLPPDFVTLFPQATSYAEGRIYRDMLPLDERATNSTLSTTTGKRILDLAALPVLPLVVEGFALITPSGQTDPSLGTLVDYDAGSLDLIDMIWPNEATTVAPTASGWAGRYWALLNPTTLVFAPTVDNAYRVKLTGDFAPIPISAANPTTYLSTYYPDLLTAACMVFLTGALLRNFGAQADDPKMAASWESQYSEKLLPNAILEEQRRRSQGVGWSQQMPTPIAQPQRK